MTVINFKIPVHDKMMTRINSRKSVTALLYVIPMFCSSPVALAEWAENADVGIRHDSNINNAQMPNDIAAVSAINAGVSAINRLAMENGNSVIFSADVKGEAFERYTGLNNVSLGAALAFRKKWALGIYAPWTALALSTARLNYANNIRNGWKHQIAIRGGKRIHERLDLRAEYMYERRTANTLPPDQPGISGDVFSLNSRTMALNAEYLLDENTFLTGGILYRRGDVVASTSETQQIIAASSAIAADPVFGPHFYAYKMDGTTYGLNVDLNYSMTTHSWLRASLSRQITHTTGDNNYAKTIEMVSWNYNY